MNDGYRNHPAINQAGVADKLDGRGLHGDHHMMWISHDLATYNKAKKAPQFYE